MEIQLDDITIHCEEIGSGRPIIFLHGQSLDHRYLLAGMEPLFEERTDWRRVYVDLPGHGQTDAPDWIAHQDQVLDVLLQFLDSIVPDQSITLVGSSYGGYLARGIIYQRPTQVNGLLLIAPAILVNRSKIRLPQRTILARDPGLLSSASTAEKNFLENMSVVQSELALRQRRMLLAPAFQLYNTDFMDRLMSNIEFSFDVDMLNEAFPGPTLILLGRQDHIIGYQDAWNILDNFPRATFAVLDGAGHLLGISEQISLYIALVNEWLDRLESYLDD